MPSGGLTMNAASWCSPLGVLLKHDLAVVIHQGEPNKDFIPSVPINVGDGGIMAGGTGVAPEHLGVVRHAPHVPVAVLHHQVFAPPATGQVGKEKAVIGRRGQAEAGLLLPRAAVEHDHGGVALVARRSLANRARIPRRAIQILRLLDVEDLVGSVTVPVIDLHGEIAIGPAVILRGRAGLPQDFAGQRGCGQARDDARAVEVLHEEDIRRTVAVEVANPDRLGQEVLAEYLADQVDLAGLVRRSSLAVGNRRHDKHRYQQVCEL